MGGLAGLMLAELMARAYCALRPGAPPILMRFHPFLGYELRPNRSTTLQDRFGARRYSTNSLGLRGRDVPVRKGPNTFRVICVGGSTTENAYVNDEQTYPSQLERMLQARYPQARIEVLNAGRSAYSTAHTLINFQLNLAGLAPDLLVVYQAINDLMPMSYPDFKADYRNFYGGYHLRRLIELDLQQPPWPAWLAGAGLGRVALRARRRVMQWDYEGYNEQPDQLIAELPRFILRAYGRNLSHLIVLAKAQGSDVCLCTFAHMIDFGMKGEDMRRLRRFPWFHHLSPRAAYDAISAMNGMVRQLHREHRTLWVDAEKTMPKSYDLFIDTCHMRAPGLTLFAEGLRDAIVASGIVERRLQSR